MTDYNQLIKALKCTGDGNEEVNEDDCFGCGNTKCPYRASDGACDTTSMCFDAAAAIERLLKS